MNVGRLLLYCFYRHSYIWNTPANTGAASYSTHQFYASDRLPLVSNSKGRPEIL